MLLSEAKEILKKKGYRLVEDTSTKEAQKLLLALKDLIKNRGVGVRYDTNKQELIVDVSEVDMPYFYMHIHYNETKNVFNVDCYNRDNEGDSLEIPSFNGLKKYVLTYLDHLENDD